MRDSWIWNPADEAALLAWGGGKRKAALGPAQHLTAALGFQSGESPQSWHASDTGALTSPACPPTQDSSPPAPSKRGDSYLTGLGHHLRTVHASVIPEAPQAALRARTGLTRRLPLWARGCRHREGAQASFLLCSPGRGHVGPACASFGRSPSVQAWSSPALTQAVGPLKPHLSPGHLSWPPGGLCGAQLYRPSWAFSAGWTRVCAWEAVPSVNPDDANKPVPCIASAFLIFASPPGGSSVSGGRDPLGPGDPGDQPMDSPGPFDGQPWVDTQRQPVGPGQSYGSWVEA